MATLANYTHPLDADTQTDAYTQYYGSDVDSDDVEGWGFNDVFPGWE